MAGSRKGPQGASVFLGASVGTKKSFVRILKCKRKVFYGTLKSEIVEWHFIHFNKAFFIAHAHGKIENSY